MIYLWKHIHQWYYPILKQNLKVCYLKTFSDYKKYYSLTNFANYQVIIIAYELLLNPNYRKSIINLPTYKFSRILYDNLTDYLIDNKSVLLAIQLFQTQYKYIITNKTDYSNRELSEILTFISNFNKEISIKQLAETIKDIVGFKGKLYFNVAKPDGTMRKCTDTKRLLQNQWNEKIELKEGIKKLISSL